MKALLISLYALMVVVPSYAILGLEYGPGMSKFYNPYYMGLKKGLEAEKGLEMAHIYSPLVVKEKLLGYGKSHPYYIPMLAKEKELEYEMGKEMAMHYPFLAQEKEIAARIGKGKMI